jgi:hypothetical protein
VILSIPAFYTATRSSSSTLVKVWLIRKYCRKSHCCQLEGTFWAARFIEMPRGYCAIARRWWQFGRWSCWWYGRFRRYDSGCGRGNANGRQHRMCWMQYTIESLVSQV